MRTFLRLANEMRGKALVNTAARSRSPHRRIVDNADIVQTPQLYVRDAIVDEKDGNAIVPVMLGGPAGQASNSTVSVNYATVNGTASAGSDYSAQSGTLSFAPGQTVQNITIPITDTGAKPTEILEISLSDATNATIADATGVVVIGASSSSAAPQPALSAPADVGVDEGVGYVDLPVRLSTPGQSTVTVAYATANGTAFTSSARCNNGSDYVGTNGTLSFGPGETTKVVHVQVLDCTDIDPNQTFSFTLTAPGNATIARPTTVITIVVDGTATPNNTALPPISGSPQPGQTLTATAGTWTGTPTNFLYQWERCDTTAANCAAIGGATGASYLLTGADLSHRLRVQVTASNALWTGLVAYSLPTPVAATLASAPLSVSAVPRYGSRSGEVVVTFTPPVSDGGWIDTYTVTASPGGITATGTGSPIVLSG